MSAYEKRSSEFCCNTVVVHVQGSCVLFPKTFLLFPFHSDYLKFPFPSSSLTSKETLKVYTSLSGVGRTKSFTWSDACLEERLNAVEKLYKIRLTCRKAKPLIFWRKTRVFLMRHRDVFEGHKIPCLLHWTQIMPHGTQSTQHHVLNNQAISITASPASTPVTFPAHVTLSELIEIRLEMRNAAH